MQKDYASEEEVKDCVVKLNLAFATCAHDYSIL